jgi:dTDP-4-amino-4,6-dideoxygalactose transaminase
MLTERFSRVPGLRVPTIPGHIGHAFYKYYTFVAQEQLAEGWDRARIAQAISEQGVPCSHGSCSEVYLEEAFPCELRPRERLAVARELGESSLMFLVHPTLHEAHIERTCDVVEDVMSRAARPQRIMATAAGI